MDKIQASGGPKGMPDCTQHGSTLGV